MTLGVDRRLAILGGVAVLAQACAPLARSARLADRSRALRLSDPAVHGFRIGDSRPIGYVCDEWLVDGQAPVDGGESISLPFRTRILVYRPHDMRRFSGIVITETIHHHDGGSIEMWQMCSRGAARAGHVWLAIQDQRSFPELNRFDPARYGRMALADPAQHAPAWGEVIRLLVTGELLGKAHSVRRVIVTGWSNTAGFAARFAASQQRVLRRSDGRPMIDGYLNGGSRDPQFEVPVIRIATSGDFYGFTDSTPLQPHLRFGNDRDGPLGRSRYYEVAGAPHGLVRTGPEAFQPAPLAWGTSRTCLQTQFPAGAVQSDLPLDAMMEAALANLCAWIETGTPPPRTPLLQLADNPVKGNGGAFDHDGNPKGGLRLPQLRVPIARYGVGLGSCQLVGYRLNFPADRCRALYGTRIRYLEMFDNAVDSMVAERLILHDRAEAMKWQQREQSAWWR